MAHGAVHGAPRVARGGPAERGAWLRGERSVGALAVLAQRLAVVGRQDHQRAAAGPRQDRVQGGARAASVAATSPGGIVAEALAPRA
jgi:hypothetical protein